MTPDGGLTRRQGSVALVAVAGICLLFADLQITASDPWPEFARMMAGLVTPDFLGAEALLSALAYTVAFAVLGTLGGAAGGLVLALGYHWRVVRAGCAFVRAIHELFWALIFLQVFGLSPITGLLAVAVPYAGIFAKVYSEILEEASTAPLQAVPAGAGRISTLIFVRLTDVWPQIRSYSYYRLECGLRSSAVLGFVGLPTLGFHLESAFSQGAYSLAAAYLFLLFGLIGSIRFWLPVRLLAPAAVLCVFLLPSGRGFELSNLVRFITHDIVPAPLRGDVDTSLWAWLSELLVHQAWPGIINTVLVTQVALVATGVLTLLVFPLVSRRFVNLPGRIGGHALLLVLRSTPEYMLAFMLLQLWGPSMLPAVVALALHNGAIIGFLTGRHSELVPLRSDAPRGFDRYGYEILPRVYGQFLAFLFYRWEIIMRETAVLGMLGVATLGFYVDSAMAELRMDRAMVLLLITAALNMVIDATSRRLRAGMHLTSRPDC